MDHTIWVVWTPDGNVYFCESHLKAAMKLAVGMVLNTYERYDVEQKETVRFTFGNERLKEVLIEIGALKLETLR